MGSSGEHPFLTRRINRRAFAAGTLATGSLVAAALRLPSVAAASFGPGDQVETTDYVNYRSAPGLNSTVYTVLPPGHYAVVQDSGTVKDGYTWYLIRIATGGDHPTGYVAGDFLKLTSTGNSFSPGDGVVTTSAVNYRNAPGLSSTVLAVLPQGTYAVVQDNGTDKDGYTWYLIKLASGGPNPTGYVAGEFLALGSPPSGKFNIGDAVYVNSGPLNFRATPSLSGTILRTLQTDDTGQVTDGPAVADGYTWYQLKISTGEVGWAVQDFLSPGSPPSSGVKVGDTIKVVDGPLNIRSGPGSTYSVIDMAATGAIATVVDGPTSANGYTWIKINGNLLAVGWVAFEFCTVV